MLKGKKVLIIICGGIAAFKVLELIRRLKSLNAHVIPVMTPSAKHFITEMSVACLSGSKVYSELFDLTDETEIGHIKLAQSADIILVAPATADFMAKIASGICSNLAETVVAAASCKIVMIPAMNVTMWDKKANQRVISTLKNDGFDFIGPSHGEMACGDFGDGRFVDVEVIQKYVEQFFRPKKLEGKRVLITSGSTLEIIDPIRFISNRSSGRQGVEIAVALHAYGAEVIFVSGPSLVKPPAVSKIINVETADQMYDAVMAQESIDVVICVAAVGDWKIKERSDNKLKKEMDKEMTLTLIENRDILKAVANFKKRPSLVIGFAAETQDVLENAKKKRLQKNCDWILANDVSTDGNMMGSTFNTVSLITATGVEKWPKLSKSKVGYRLAEKIAEAI